MAKRKRFWDYKNEGVGGGSPVPKGPSLIEVAAKNATEEACIEHFERIRWPQGLRCIRCGGLRVFKFDTKGKTDKVRHLYECVDCRYQFSVLTGTIFHDSHTPLTKWFLAIYMICSAKKGISAKQLQRDLKVTYKTAWYMAHRVRLAMKEDAAFCEKFGGIVEVDETYVGGKTKGRPGRGGPNKIPVVGMKERTSGKVRLQAMKDVSQSSLAAFVRRHAKPNTWVYTDEFSGYNWIDSSEFTHDAVKHSETYVLRGPIGQSIHTNGVEGVWSLFKRAIVGQFHKVSEKYLPLYLDEFAYRFNHRHSVNLMDRVLETSC